MAHCGIFQSSYINMSVHIHPQGTNLGDKSLKNPL